MEGTSYQTDKNAMWQNIRRKARGKCLSPKHKKMNGKNGGASAHAPSRKYMYFAGKVLGAMLRIPTSQLLLSKF